MSVMSRRPEGGTPPPIMLDHKFLMGLAGFPELPEGGDPPPTMLDGTMIVFGLTLTYGARETFVASAFEVLHD